MNEKIRALLSQNFYATTDEVRNFFAFSKDINVKEMMAERSKIAISSYGSEVVEIRINGLMLREKSWITDFGFAVSTEEVIEEIDNALEAGKRISLMMNTGGGLVSGTSNLAKKVFENRDKIDAYATGMVASAGMWVFASAGKRFAEDTTMLGSIGVVTSVFDDEKYWESHGIVWKEVVSENAKNKRPNVKTESGQAEVKRYLTSLETIFIDSISASLDMSR
ncbi:MAG: S49 family peptidase, partial [Candidatus Thermoplasmatota archaeon]|nr:S49 family peptidase [Candidatus Thermoplasmatota archaeon]